MTTKTFKIEIKITDSAGKRTGRATLLSGRGDVLNIVERDYMSEDITDHRIVSDLADMVPMAVMRWDEDDKEYCEFQHDAPYGEFPAGDKLGISLEKLAEEAMLSGDYSDLGDTMVSIARAAGAQFDYDTGADMSDDLSDDER